MRPKLSKGAQKATSGDRCSDSSLILKQSSIRGNRPEKGGAASFVARTSQFYTWHAPAYEDSVDSRLTTNSRTLVSRTYELGDSCSHPCRPLIPPNRGLTTPNPAAETNPSRLRSWTFGGSAHSASPLKILSKHKARTTSEYMLDFSMQGSPSPNSRARDNFLARLGALLSRTLRHVVAPSTAEGYYPFHEKVVIQLYLVSQVRGFGSLEFGL